MTEFAASTDAVKVKICGITRVGDAVAAAQAGADYLGYVFYSKSPRCIDVEGAAPIIAQIRSEYPNVRHVGLFVNESFDTVFNTHKTCGLDLAQLHGEEAPALCSDLSQKGVRVIKALKFGRSAPLVKWTFYRTAFFLCDTYDPESAGGSGRPFDYSLIPYDLPMKRVFMAGGLTPANVGSVVASLHPFAVDVSSGVEEQPGQKSPELIRQFIAAARANPSGAPGR